MNPPPALGFNPSSKTARSSRSGREPESVQPSRLQVQVALPLWHTEAAGTRRRSLLANGADPIGSRVEPRSEAAMVELMAAAEHAQGRVCAGLGP